MFDTIPEALTLVREVYTKLGDHSLADKIRIEFNPRLTSCMGTARFSQKVIHLSLPLWRRATTKQRRDLIIHEACHLFAEHRCGSEIRSHGAEWRYFMCKAGIEPSAKHDVQPLNRFFIRCNCGTVSCSRCVVDQLMAGDDTSCQVCHTALLYVSDIAGLKNTEAVSEAT